MLKGSRGRTITVQGLDPTNAMKLAYEALVLIEAGASERSAVQSAVQVDPSLLSAKRETLDLVLKICERRDQLDKIILHVFKEKQVKPRTRCLLRLAAQQFLGSKDFEDFRTAERGFRDFTRREDMASIELLLGAVVAQRSSDAPTSATDVEELALDKHYPVWWVNYCCKVFGRGETVKLLSALPRPRYIRVNSLRNRGRSSLPRAASSVSPNLMKIGSDPPTYTLSGAASTLSKFFSEGLFQIQDKASFLAVQAASPKPGEDVLDVCAAPGGKTATLAQLMKNRGRIISVDYSATRMRSWEREVSRLGAKIAEPLISDATNLSIKGEFDLVVVDPPCSGTGILDRNPSMKWHLSEELVERFARIQQRILESVSRLVNETGRILYCTCSVTVEENEDVISAFIKSNPEFETRPVLEKYGTPGLGGLSNCRRLWPHRDRTAGYFVSRMERTP